MWGKCLDPQPESALRPVTIASYWKLLGENRNFRKLWLAQIVSEVGDWFYTLSIYSLLLELTGHAGSVALALVLQVLPQTFVGPTAGVVNDRVSRKAVMITADITRMLIVLAMLLVRSRSTVWLVYPLLLCETVMAAFFEPARSSVIPNITRREDVILANTLSSTTWSLNLVMGAALGGVVAALLGRNAVFVLNALSFLISALLIRGMRFAEPHVKSEHPLRVGDLVDFSPIMEGVRYVRSRKDLLATVFVKAGNLVIGPSWVLFTVMGHRQFALTGHGLSLERSGMVGMSLLLAARGLGALIGPLISAPWAGHSLSRLQLGILLAYLAMGVGYALIGFCPSVWLACSCIVLAHCGGATTWVFSTTLLQLRTEDRFRGRVFSTDLGLCMLTIAICAFITGKLVDIGISTRILVSAAGVAMLLPAGLWAWAVRSMRSRPVELLQA
jgi:MFS family permease